MWGKRSVTWEFFYLSEKYYVLLVWKIFSLYSRVHPHITGCSVNARMTWSNSWQSARIPRIASRAHYGLQPLRCRKPLGVSYPLIVDASKPPNQMVHHPSGNANGNINQFDIYRINFTLNSIMKVNFIKIKIHFHSTNKYHAFITLRRFFNETF